MKSKLNTTAIVLLALLNVATLLYVSQTKNELALLSESIDNKTSQVVVYEGKNGYTPVKGKDYFDGAAGINAMSYTVSNTVIKELPIIGPQGPAGNNGVDGINGQDAPIQEIRINPETGDLQSKMSNERYWSVLVLCRQLQVGCKNAD